MRLRFDDEALDDLQSIFAWIAKDDPQAARGVVNRIFEKAERLLTPALTRLGRPGRDPGTHELLEGCIPYILTREERPRASDHNPKIVKRCFLGFTKPYF